MVREYIARDPRTGLPLNVARSKKVDKKIVSQTGPWVSISDVDVLPLARGEIDRSKLVTWTELTLMIARQVFELLVASAVLLFMTPTVRSW